MRQLSTLDPPIGVWGPGGWYFPGDAQAEPVPEQYFPRHDAPGMLDTARELGLSQLWIPHAEAPMMLALDAVPGWTLRHDAPIHRWVWASDGVRTAIEIAVIPADPRRYVWGGLGPHELLEELGAFYRAYGLWHSTGATTSDRWLRTHYRERSTLRLAPSEVVDVPVDTPAIHFVRPAAKCERGLYLHSWDINGMYLAAASSLALPVGKATHVGPSVLHPETPHSPATRQQNLPGYFKIEGKDSWVTTPTLELMIQVHGDVHVEQSFVWETHHRWLEPWYRALRDARAELGRGSVAARALKEVYTAGVGRLGSTRRSSGTDPLYQPYWRHAVIAEANARLSRKIRQARDRAGVAPIAVDVATGGDASPVGPSETAETLGFKMSDQLGHWKHTGSASPGEWEPETYLPTPRALKNLRRLK